MQANTSIRFLSIVIILAGIWFTSSPAAAASTITVTTTLDNLTDDGQCSLRESIIAANTDTATGGCPAGSGADTIVFDPALPDPAIFALTLTGMTEDGSTSGDLDLTGILTIQGLGAGKTIIDGNSTDRVFDVRPGATVVLSGLTVQNGNPGSDANGGGIIVTGGTPRAKLTLSNSIVTANTALMGGGIQVSGNGASALIEYTRINLNTAVISGGGIANSGDLKLQNSTVDQNRSRTGGGIEHSGISLHLTNDTISANIASDNGGGLYNRADALVLNVTFSANTASGPGTGGNIYNDDTSIAIKNSILANSDADGNCFNNDGTLLSQGSNLDSGSSCGFTANGDLSASDPMLGPLQDNGGVTFTHALLTGSPAIDRGISNGWPAIDRGISNGWPAIDQRGFMRPVDGNGDGSADCDMGSYEFDTGIATTPSPTPTDASTPTATAQTPTVTLTATPVPPTPPPGSPCPGIGFVLILALFGSRSLFLK